MEEVKAVLERTDQMVKIVLKEVLELEKENLWKKNPVGLTDQIIRIIETRVTDASQENEQSNGAL